MASQSAGTGGDGNQVHPLCFDASIWIACCSGPLQISKTSFSISGPTSTTIARIPHWKGERRIRRCHDQSQISARFDGNLTVVTYTRHQWLRNFPKTLDRCVSGQPWENFQLTHLMFAFLVAVRFADPIVSLPTYQFARDSLPKTSSGPLRLP